MKKPILNALAAAMLLATGAVSAQVYERGPDYRDDRGGWFDEEAACQSQVRAEIMQRNRGRIDVDFRPRVRKEDLGMGRERIRGAGDVSRRGDESARFGYECIVNDRRNRVVTATYELRGQNSFR